MKKEVDHWLRYNEQLEGSEQVCACLAHNSSLSSPIGVVYFPQVKAIPALAALAS